MISHKDIEHLKDLARVEFGEKETEALAEDLSAILDYAAILQSVDVSNVSEMTHASATYNVMREDVCIQLSEAEDIRKAFPENKNGYLKVKAIFS